MFHNLKNRLQRVREWFRERRDLSRYVDLNPNKAITDSTRNTLKMHGLTSKASKAEKQMDSANSGRVRKTSLPPRQSS